MPGHIGHALDETPDLRPETVLEEANLTEPLGSVSPKRSPPSRFSRELRQVTEEDEFDDIDLSEPAEPVKPAKPAKPVPVEPVKPTEPTEPVELAPTASLKRKPRSRPNSYLGFQSVINSFTKKPDLSLHSKKPPKAGQMPSSISSTDSSLHSSQLHTAPQSPELPELQKTPETHMENSESNQFNQFNQFNHTGGQNSHRNDHQNDHQNGKNDHQNGNNGNTSSHEQARNFDLDSSVESLPIPPKSPNRLNSMLPLSTRTGNKAQQPISSPRASRASPRSSSHASNASNASNASSNDSPQSLSKPPSPLRQMWSPVFNPEEQAERKYSEKGHSEKGHSETPATPPFAGSDKPNSVLQTPVSWNRSPIRLPLSTEHMDNHRILFNDPGSRFGSPKNSPKQSPGISSPMAYPMASPMAYPAASPTASPSFNPSFVSNSNSNSNRSSMPKLKPAISSTDLETGSEAGSLAFERVEEFVNETEQLNSEDWERDGAVFDVEPVNGDLTEQIEAMKLDMNRSLSNSNHSRNHSMTTESMLQFPQSVYRTPIPTTLMRPPILSKGDEPALHSKNAFKRLKLPPKPKWGPSPLEPVSSDLYNEQQEEDIDSDGSFSSDGATILSDEEELERDHELIDEENVDKEPAKKKKKWLRKLFKSSSSSQYKNMEEGDEEEVHKGPEDTLEQEQMLEFSRLNLENVQNQAEMLGLGARHAVSSNPDEVPSLVEEIEIRKRARKLQRDVINRDVGRIDILRDLNPSWHPMAESAVPTLMQMQSAATVEYKQRQSWMSKALQGTEGASKPNFENEEPLTSAKRLPSRTLDSSSVNHLRVPNPPKDTETLAQRRAKLKLSKETLSQRRERIKREKQKIQDTHDSHDPNPHPHPHNPDPHDPHDPQSAVECS